MTIIKSKSKYKLVLLLMLTIATQFAYAQSIISGRVINEKGEPIPFVSIGIANASIGTISELNGDFELKIPKKFTSDRIFFSSIGYMKTSISIEKNVGIIVEILLKEDVRRLDEVIVVSKKIKPKVKKVGKSYPLEGRFMTDYDYSGAAMAQLVVSPFDTTQIHWLNLGYFNKIEDLKLRVKFYSVNSIGLPDELVFANEIIVDLYEFDGFHKIKLDDYFVYVTEKEFFVVLEPLILKKNREDVYNTISQVYKETPNLIKHNEYGEILINNSEIDLNFFQFKISGKRKETTFYCTSSFGKWYESEELSLLAGLSDINEDVGLTAARVETELNTNNKTSIDVYKRKTTIQRSTLADYLRKVGGLSVEGKGEDVKVFVRGGVTSILYSNEPIFVVDGVNIGRGYANTIAISTSHIESIEVLRGPVQTTIYGEQGNNGVIIIKTSNSQ